MDLTGQTISHYKVLEKLGQGGMGVVFKAQDLELGRHVALKFLPPAYSKNSEIGKRFKREAQAAAALNHPNVVTVYEIGYHEDHVYIAMEFVSGDSLRNIIQRGQLAYDHAQEIAMQICAGLCKAHQAEIVHRDIKPENILIEAGGQIKIVDFGLAKVKGKSRLTQEGSGFGTYNYMSPEQYKNLEIDHRADIWAFGVVFYELLTGELPFKGDYEAAIMYSIINEDPEPARAHRQDLPHHFEEILEKSLAKEPDQRFGRFEDVLALLQKEKKGVAMDTEDVNISNLSEAAINLDDLEERLRLPDRRQHENPYLNRVMIRDVSGFYGRTSEFQRIYARFAAAARPQSISIVGERRIGKSSLLHYLYHPATRKKHLPEPHKYVFAFIDFQEEQLTSVDAFFQAIFDSVRQEYEIKFDLPEKMDYQSFKTLVRQCDARGLRLIILIDEFDAVTSNPIFEADFFSFLRSMANKYNIAYAVTTARDLQTLCHSKEIATSPFFNIFSNLNLGVFKPEEARELICGPSAEAGFPLQPFVDNIVSLAGYFPFYLQIACSAYFEQMKEHDLSWDALHAEAKKQFLEEAEVHFKNTWENLDERERNVVHQIIAGKKLRESEQYLVTKLQRSGCVSNAGDLRLFSDAFAEYIINTTGGGKAKRGFWFWRKG